MENNSYTLQAKRPLSVDGVQRGPAANPGPAAQPAQPTPKRRAYYAPRPEPAKKSYWQIVQLPLLLIAGATGGFFAETLAVGLALLLIYGVVAFANRIGSRTTFTLALLLLAAISVLLLFKPNMQLIRNFATYAFVLLIIGVITLGREARLPKRTRRKYRR